MEPYYFTIFKPGPLLHIKGWGKQLIPAEKKSMEKHTHIYFPAMFINIPPGLLR